MVSILDSEVSFESISAFHPRMDQMTWMFLRHEDLCYPCPWGRSRQCQLTGQVTQGRRPRLPWGDLQEADSPTFPAPFPALGQVERPPLLARPLADLLCSHHCLQPPLVVQALMHFLHLYKIYSRQGDLFSTFMLNREDNSS